MKEQENYYNFIEKNKQTGKTSRMMEKAVELAKNGKFVYVVTHDKNMVDYCKRKISKENMHFLNSLKIQVNSVSECNSGSIDWDNLRLRGYPNSCLLLDHYVLEIKFSSILNSWLSNFETNKECES